MKAACVFHHDWEGCKCRRCGQLRDTHHDWDGCQCRQCHVVRDEQHDRVTVDCRVSCRRCGWQFGWNHHWQGCICEECGQLKPEAAVTDHDWDGCVCRRCQQTRDAEHDWEGCTCRNCTTTRHQWSKQGRCERCGLACKHPKVETSWDISSSDETVSGAGSRYCSICGKTLGPVQLKHGAQAEGFGEASAS